MRKLFIGLTAVAGIAIASPALAEGFYFGGPGVGVGVDVGPRYYRDYDAPRYRAYDYDRPRYRGCQMPLDGLSPTDPKEWFDTHRKGR